MKEREALKLALEELAVRFSEGWHEGIKIDASDIMLLNNAAEALAQPQRTWVGLTDDEIDLIDESNWKDDHKVWDIHEFARAIEAKLKEKNT